MAIGLYLLGGANSRGQGKSLWFTYNNIVNKTNDWYYKSGNRASWSKRSKPSAGGGLGVKASPGQKIGIKRLGGKNNI